MAWSELPAGGRPQHLEQVRAVVRPKHLRAPDRRRYRLEFAALRPIGSQSAAFLRRRSKVQRHGDCRCETSSSLGAVHVDGSGRAQPELYQPLYVAVVDREVEPRVHEVPRAATDPRIAPGVRVPKTAVGSTSRKKPLSPQVFPTNPLSSALKRSAASSLCVCSARSNCRSASVRASSRKNGVRVTTAPAAPGAVLRVRGVATRTRRVRRATAVRRALLAACSRNRA
jgi:hypothetical protein